MVDVLIVGGGVVGLSLAYELAGHHLRVQVIDRQAAGREASWAGAGILPPTGTLPADDPASELLRLSNALHAEWAQRLRDETGIDNGFRRCGGIYVARHDEDARALQAVAAGWRARGVAAEPLTGAELAEIEPSLAGDHGAALVRTAWLLRDEAQLRNPRHLKALLAACAVRGVEVSCGVAAEDFQLVGRRIEGVRTSEGSLSAGAVCLTSGPWTKGLLARLGVAVRMQPVRGQIVLLSGPRPLLRRIVNDGPCYLVPRPEGRVLVGSTEEDVGFDKRTTAAGVAGLLEFAMRLAPGLGEMQVEQCWAGLRPGTFDGRPFLGALPGLENAFVAAGHFRVGLQLSPGTAVVMSRLIRGLPAGVELAPFRVGRLEQGSARVPRRNAEP